MNYRSENAIVGGRVKVHRKIIKKMYDASKKWRKSADHEKQLEMYFQQRNWGQWINSLCSSRKRPMTMPGLSLCFLVKSGPLTVSLFLLQHKHFKLRDLNSEDFSLNSRHGPLDIYINYRSENALVGGRIKVHPKTVEKMDDASKKW